MIYFNKPFRLTENSFSKLENYGALAGDGPIGRLCSEWLEETLSCPKVLLTTSCTHALEMAALLLDISPGDEVIVPSFTFVSTANAFVLRGATPVFIDIRPDTMNINEVLIEQAITPKTKAIIIVHYAGVSCEMDKVMSIAKKHNLIVIEDAAHALMSTYKGKYLGTFGHLGCISFHETKNFHCGEGGALLINNPLYLERAEIIRDKGTNRKAFLRGEIDKYSWVDIGSSYTLSDLNAMYLYPQLLIAHQINNDRVEKWNFYYYEIKNSKLLLDKIVLPFVPEYCGHNGHIFYIKLKNQIIRDSLMTYLKENGVIATFHYVPLHSSKIGKVVGRFNETDIYTTSESEKILRLPMYYDLKLEDIKYIVSVIERFFVGK